MNKNIIYSIIALFIWNLFPNGLWAQNQSLTTIQSKIVDESGKPLANVNVYSDNRQARTREDGTFTLKVNNDSRITIEADGYQNRVLVVSEIEEETQLVQSSLYYDDEDLVNLPFRSVKKGDVVGAANSLDVSDISSYDNSIWLNGILSGRTLGMLGSNNIRGLGVSLDIGSLIGTQTGTAMVVVDGMPRDINGVRLSDIESITVLRDVNSAVLYGTAAMNGVVLITTKRGEAYKRTADFSVNYGVSFPRSASMPEYLGSAEYMEYYNQARINDGFAPTYSDEMINNYRNGNKYRYPSIDYYSNEYLKSSRNSVDLNAQFSGGDERLKYLADLAWKAPPPFGLPF